MSDTRYAKRQLSAVAVGALVVLAGLTAAGIVGTASSPTFDSSTAEGGHANVAGAQDAPDNETREDEYVVPAPDRGDEYFEAAASDGSWISYDNPRDRYRSPYLGEGSGKICVTLLNSAGEVVEGESVPGTTVTVPTGDSVSWHADADPMSVEYPLSDNYEWPLDADQFGTDPDLPQGDGYMDAHCIEIHGLPGDGGTVEYGEAEIHGEYADRIDVVGYVQQEHVAGWDSDVDPVADAEPYEEAGGGWTYRTDASHGQVVVVLQLEPPGENRSDDGTDEDVENRTDEPGTETATETPTDTAPDSTVERNTPTATDDPSDRNGTDDPDEGTAPDETTTPDQTNTPDESDADWNDGSPGFGVLAAFAALGVAALANRRR